MNLTPNPESRDTIIDVIAVQRGAMAEAVKEARRFGRVEVRLLVAVVLDRASAYVARTENVSEGGILLSNYHGPELGPGRLVALHITGILSDADDTGDEHYLMRIVRHCGDTLALRFSESG